MTFTSMTCERSGRRVARLSVTTTTLTALCQACGQHVYVSKATLNGRTYYYYHSHRKA